MSRRSQDHASHRPKLLRGCALRMRAGPRGEVRVRLRLVGFGIKGIEQFTLEGLRAVRSARRVLYFAIASSEVQPLFDLLEVSDAASIDDLYFDGPWTRTTTIALSGEWSMSWTPTVMWRYFSMGIPGSGSPLRRNSSVDSKAAASCSKCSLPRQASTQ